MKETIDELETILKKYLPLLEKIEEPAWRAKPFAGKWSKIEELGHLVDSAQSNIRRFVVGQYEEQPFIVYQQDKWVAISNYQNYAIADLLSLWWLINKHICVILKNTTVAAASRNVLTQAVHSIAWLAADYNKHLLHHLHHILELEPVAYP
ncbi:MAG: DinB family protein [Chitinophagaceae bacterium]